MNCCYFNSCILNDNRYLQKYKKKFTNLDGKLTKEIFINVDKNNEVLTSLNINSGIKKKYIFCDEHHNQLKELIKIKRTINSKPDNIPKETLISLNNILKNNIDIKKLSYNMDFGRYNIIKILINNISSNKDKDSKLYLYLILNQYLKEKEIVISDNFNNDDNSEKINSMNEEIYNVISKDFFNIKLKVFDIAKNKKNELIDDENFFRDVILYNLCLSNIECLIYNWNKSQKGFNPKLIIDNIIDILAQIIIGDDSIPYIISNELFYHIIGFMNIYLISDIKEPAIIEIIIKFFVEKNQEIYFYLKKYREENRVKSSTRNYMTTLNTILESMISIDLSKYDKNKLNIFVINSNEFNKNNKFELLFYKNNDMIEELKDKIRLTVEKKDN